MIEYQVLRFLLNDSKYLSDISKNKITVDYFTEKETKELFNFIIDYYSKYKTSLTRELYNEIVSTYPEDKKLSLLSIIDVVTTADIETVEFTLTLDLLKNKYKEKLLESTLKECSVHFSNNNTNKCIDVLQNGLGNLLKLNSEVIREGELRDSVEEQAQDYENRKAGVYEKVIYTGFSTLDKLTYGATEGDLWMIQGFSKVGKSTFLLNICTNVYNANGNSLYVSAELYKKAIEMKVTGILAGVPVGGIRSGKLEEDQERRFKEALQLEKTRTNMIYTMDAPGCSTLAVRMKVDELLKYTTLDAVFVDYIELLTSLAKSNSRWDMESNVALELRKIARDYRIPVFTITQISRKGKELNSTALEHSGGSIDKIRHSDVIIGLKPASQEVQVISNIHEIECTVEGNRKGATGSCKLEANFNFGLMREII